MKPKILISRSPESSGLYEAAVEKAGGEALSYHCPDPAMDFDALILAGGGDMWKSTGHGTKWNWLWSAVVSMKTSQSWESAGDIRC